MYTARFIVFTPGEEDAVKGGRLSPMELGRAETVELVAKLTGKPPATIDFHLMGEGIVNDSDKTQRFGGNQSLIVTRLAKPRSPAGRPLHTMVRFF